MLTAVAASMGHREQAGLFFNVRVRYGTAGMRIAR